jgi:hypothetical protein
VPRLYLEQFVTEKFDRGLMTEMVRQIEDAINRLSEGRIYQNYNAASAAPSGSTVAYQLGDFIKNLSPTPTGGAGSEYVILGWVCTAAGSPGTFEEVRTLTGG